MFPITLFWYHVQWEVFTLCHHSRSWTLLQEFLIFMFIKLKLGSQIKRYWFTASQAFNFRVKISGEIGPSHWIVRILLIWLSWDYLAPIMWVREVQYVHYRFSVPREKSGQDWDYPEERPHPSADRWYEFRDMWCGMGGSHCDTIILLAHSQRKSKRRQDCRCEWNKKLTAEGYWAEALRSF